MELMTNQLEKKFEEYPLYSQDSKGGQAKVIAKFFNPCGAGTWLITEASKIGDDWLMFGYCHLGNDEMAELGYVSLNELQSIVIQPFGLGIEQDLHFPNDINLSDACKMEFNHTPRFIESEDVLFSKVELEQIKPITPVVEAQLREPFKKSTSLTKEEFNTLVSEIKEITQTYQADPDLLTDYFAFKAQFYQYSPGNAILIHLQNPNATFVASFTKWKELGYSIKKGQKHIKVSRPIEVSKFLREVNGKKVWTEVKYATSEEKIRIAKGELELNKSVKFIPHQVFDISQTTCPVEDYPKIYNMGHPDMEQSQLYEVVKQYAKESGFTVTEEDLSSISLHGYYNRADNTIHINSLLEDTKRLETLCHELAHGILHKTSTQPVEIMEFEAECFGTMLKRKMGFPVSEESKRYIKQYFTKSNLHQNAKFDMNKTLDRLSKTFNHVSNSIEETMSNMGYSRNREFSHNLAQSKANAISPNKISENFIQAL